MGQTGSGVGRRPTYQWGVFDLRLPATREPVATFDRQRDAQRATNAMNAALSADDLWERTAEGCIVPPYRLGAIHRDRHREMMVDGKRMLAHRAVFLQTYGYLPKVVRHSCDNPPCINPAHLLGGTQADNVHDMHERGRARKARGEQSGRAKLTWEQVRAIRAALAAGATPASQARAYGVDHKVIRNIRDGKTWKERNEHGV
jgi:hypothetical protein